GEESKAKGRGKPGGRYDIPPTAGTDRDAARAALAGNEFVFDIQGHFLEYRVNPATRQARDFWTGFPQRGCGEQDQRLCFSITHFMEEVFLKSDTSMVILSTLPIAPEGSPMSNELMDETRRLSEALCHDKRVLLHGQAFPNVGDLSADLDAMASAAQRYRIVAWKLFTNYAAHYDGSANPWARASGIGPNQNVYAELCTTWWSVMGSPDQAAHVLGKLLKHVGENNVLWGTDALFYGAPQDQIQAFRAFQISEEYQDRFGYPALTD